MIYAGNLILTPSGDTTGTADPAALIAAQAQLIAFGGKIGFAPGTYWFGSAVPIPNGVSYQGQGQGATILKATSGLGGPIFTQVVSSGKSIINVSWRDLTLDGNTGPSGSNIGILINTNAANNIPYYNVKAQNVDFQNFLYGWQHSANNGAGSALNNETRCQSCRFDNNAVGAILRGVYASTFDDCFFTRHTINGIGTSGYNGTPAITGTDPATSIAVNGCHFEGLGNITGGGTGSDSGVSLNCTQYGINHCYFSDISLYPIFCQDNEGIGSEIGNIRAFGCGGAPIILDQGNSVTGFTAISNVVCGEVSQNAGLTAAFGQTGVISVLGGQATIKNVTVTPFGTQPPYALNLGANGNAHVGMVDVDGLHCPSPTTGYVLVNNTQGSMALKIRNSRGYNPQGTLVVAVPATTVATAAAFVDRQFYVTGAAGGSCTITVSGGPTVTVPVSVLVPVFCPAGQTVTPVYGAGNAPTWSVEGL